MKFDVDDKNRCRLVCVKFHLNRCRFAVAVAKCLGGSLFWGHSVVALKDRGSSDGGVSVLHIVCCTLPQVGASHGRQEAWMGTEKSVGKGGLLPQWEGDLRVPPLYIFWNVHASTT